MSDVEHLFMCLLATWDPTDYILMLLANFFFFFAIIPVKLWLNFAGGHRLDGRSM